MKSYEVTEWCPHCESEITMTWDVESMEYTAFCPVCGELLMLCDECQHRTPEGRCTDDCDYDSRTSLCRFNQNHKADNGNVPAGTAIPSEHTNNTCEPILSGREGKVNACDRD